MNLVKLCFGLSFSNDGSDIIDNIEELYQNKYKKIFSFLYAHPEMHISLFISGVVLEWIKKNHAEVIDILSERIDNKQLELLGGGYYEPIFPLILSADRVAQIEYLTTNIRKSIGKRPRGIYLTESIWDPSLISSFTTCGIEYTLLDSRILPQRKFHPIPLFSPLIVEDLGRTIIVIPMQQDSLPHMQQSPIEYLNFLHTISQSSECSVVSGFFTIDDFLSLIDSNWFDNFISIVNSDSIVDFSLPHDFIKNYQSFYKTYIPAGCLSDAAIWTIEPCVPHPSVFTDPIRPTVRDFLAVYPEALNLYSRMMYTSMLVNQCRGDKIRKKAAREKLLESQNYSAYLFTGQGGVTDKKLRNTTYRNLLSAEKLVRQASEFSENSSAFDLTMNGSKDYVCSFKPFNAFIGLKGGMLFELDIIQNLSNYCLASRRLQKIDGFSDMYPKKMFIDHLLDTADFTNLINDTLTSDTLLPNLTYTEIAFNRIQSKIHLKASGIWGKEEIPISIKKYYTLNENGILVQYILKNEGTRQLKAKFAVEHNFSFPGNDGDNASTEVVLTKNREKLDIKKGYIYPKNVSLVHLNDKTSNIDFMFEPNELSGYYMKPFYTVCPGSEQIGHTQYEAHTCVFYWDINVDPGCDTEKSLYLTIKTPKKKPIAKSRKK